MGVELKGVSVSKYVVGRASDTVNGQVRSPAPDSIEARGEIAHRGIGWEPRRVSVSRKHYDPVVPSMHAQTSPGGGEIDRLVFVRQQLAEPGQ